MVALVIVAIAATPALCQTSGGSAGSHTDAARFLSSYLRLTILNANGDSARRSGRLIRAVDVNGSVRVAFETSALAEYRPTIAPVEGDTTGRRLILQLLDDLTAYGQIAAALARSVREPARAFDAARDRANTWYAAYAQHVEAFFLHQVQLQEPDSTSDLRVRAAEIADPFMGRDQMGAFARHLQTELVRLLREAEQGESGGLGTLSLVAWRITPQGDSVRVGLRGYDTSATQTSTMIAKVTTVMAPDERASLEFHRDLASKVHNVRDAFAIATEEYVELAGEARAAITGLIRAVSALRDSLGNTRRRPEALVDMVPDSAKVAANRVAASLRGVAESIGAVVRPIQDLQQNLLSSSSDRNPLIMLSALSSSVNAISALGPRMSRLGDQTRALTTQIADLGRKVASIENLALPDTLLEAVTAATATYRRLESIARRATGLIEPGRNVAGVTAAFDPEWIDRLNLTPRAAASAPETEILITKAGGDRTDGDLLVFRADLLNPDNTAAGTYEWTFRLEKLDLSSRFAAGVGFAGRVFATRNDEALRPVPVLAWVLRHRTRGESGKSRLWNFVDPSPGVHVVTLSGTTQAVQFGVGLSINFFQDFIQLGLGRKLQPENGDDRYYWYFGLGLFKLAQMAQ